MGTDSFGIGVSALNAAQIGLSVTQHNIANANTPGFNRQELQLLARPANLMGSGWLGQGADVGTVSRVYDQFLSDQVGRDQLQASHLDTYYTQIQQINNMVADPTAGLSPALQDFFGAVSSVTSAPESMPARQALLSNAQTLVSRFQSMNQRLADINGSINSQIQGSVESVNGYAQQIATLNQNIALATQNSQGKPPNDLLDQRDQLVAQMNKEIKTSIVKQGDGSYNLFIGTGQTLVIGNKAYGLRAVASPNASPNDPNIKLDVAYFNGGTTVQLQQNQIVGGNLGGLLAFRSQSLDTAQNSLGLVATGLAGTFNQQHQLGQDLNGVLGNDFFVQPTPVVDRGTSNKGDAVVTANISSYSALTGSDYLLTFDAATGYTLKRLSDNTSSTYVDLPTLTAAMPVDGLTINVNPGAIGPVSGDNFLIRPTVNGALNIGVAITDPAKIAAAAPMRTNALLTNTGTGKISAGSVNVPPPVTADPAHPLTDLNLNQPVSIVFDPPAIPNTPPTTFTVTGVGVGLPAVGIPYTDGAPITYNGWTVQITGIPLAGDTFTVGPNNNASSDNRNALLLGGLQNGNTLLGAAAGGATSYQGAYSQLVTQVGNKTRELEVTSKAQDTMLQQSIVAQQSISGVNLDEEAANLMRYQRAYQAAGKAMQVANTLFDTLVALIR